MSQVDDIKAEAYRLVATPKSVFEAAERYLRSLRSHKLVPGVKLILHENHYENRDRIEITVSGSLQVVEDRPWRHDDPEWAGCKRRQNRWLCRKLRAYGELLDADPIRVSTRDDTVYFSYHVVVEQLSHL